MPINNDLEDKQFPMVIRDSEVPSPNFIHSHKSLDVVCTDAPDRQKMLKYIAPFTMATWEDSPKDWEEYTLSEREETLKKVLSKELLPNVMETMQFTFRISNIDLIDVTHILRHRSFTFSAHCSGDRDQRNDDVLIKPSILVNSFFRSRYMTLVEQLFELYGDMVDSKLVSILDARTVMPKSLANHYYLSSCLKDLIPFFKQRLDRQIQPESDNLIALKMLIEVAKVVPEIGSIVSLDTPDHYYISTAKTDHSSNLFPPEPKNDLFEWKPQWFIYECERSQMPGAEYFNATWKALSDEYKELVKGYE